MTMETAQLPSTESEVIHALSALLPEGFRSDDGVQEIFFDAAWWEIGQHYSTDTAILWAACYGICEERGWDVTMKARSDGWTTVAIHDGETLSDATGLGYDLAIAYALVDALNTSEAGRS